jgi:hypothetical protein
MTNYGVRWAVLVLTVVLIGCATVGIPGVHRGQTKAEVLEVLGPPDKTSVPATGLFGREIWWWQAVGETGQAVTRAVIWRGDRVSSVQVITPAKKTGREERQ